VDEFVEEVRELLCGFQAQVQVQLTKSLRPRKQMHSYQLAPLDPLDQEAPLDPPPLPGLAFPLGLPGLMTQVFHSVL
jgi:hypothetical protein